MPAALLYCKSIIACAKAIQDVQLEDMGCSVGEYNINALELEDKMCIRKSEKRIEEKYSMRTRKLGEEGQKKKKERQGRTSCGSGRYNLQSWGLLNNFL